MFHRGLAGVAAGKQPVLEGVPQTSFRRRLEAVGTCAERERPSLRSMCSSKVQALHLENVRTHEAAACEARLCGEETKVAVRQAQARSRAQAPSPSAAYTVRATSSSSCFQRAKLMCAMDGCTCWKRERTCPTDNMPELPIKFGQLSKRLMQLSTPVTSGIGYEEGCHLWAWRISGTEQACWFHRRPAWRGNLARCTQLHSLSSSLPSL